LLYSIGIYQKQSSHYRGPYRQKRAARPLCIFRVLSCGLPATGRCSTGRRLEPVQTLTRGVTLHKIGVFLRCRQSEYTKYSSLLRLEIHSILHNLPSTRRI
jgi:hypothetical protein